MLDFLIIKTKTPRKGEIEVYPDWEVRTRKDLMIKGQKFYAVWIEEVGLWSTKQDDVINLVDHEIDIYCEAKLKDTGMFIVKRYMHESSSGAIDSWHKYCQKQAADNFVMLDGTLVFANMKPERALYSSKRLPYALEPGDYSAYRELMSVLYSPEERHKIEWAIGSIVNGASRELQKFLVFYGAAGTGKSTVMNIIGKLFEGYTATFDAQALGSRNSTFALEPFKNGPLVGIQHDGDLSRIEDNTGLNSLVSHESMVVNEKYTSLYTNRFKTFLFMGTNRPVRITDAKSGLMRRLIDVSPTGKKLPSSDYKRLMKQIEFELGAIAWHCKEVFEDDPLYYDSYVPIKMMGASNDFYNFMEANYLVFKDANKTSMKIAWEMYKLYADDARVPHPMSMRIFKEELKNYFWEFKERAIDEEGNFIRNQYIGFRTDKFDIPTIGPTPKVEEKTWLEFEEHKVSLLKDILNDCPAQYASAKETPSMPWSKVEQFLRDLDETRLHYVKVPLNHIVIDFDIPGEDGNKDFEANLKAASQWPKTYAELSKSGKGIHLHYLYSGDPLELENLYAEHIEIKVFNGKSALRRKLTKCNDIPIATLSSGLPLKEKKAVVNSDSVKSEKALRKLVIRNLNKEIHKGTKPSMDFIKKILDDAYASGMVYDLTDLKSDIIDFASNSTHNAKYCMMMVKDLKLKSETVDESVSDNNEDALWFFDFEVFPNVIFLNYKKDGDEKIYHLINPKPEDIEMLSKKKLIGHNCRRYDNHIAYAIMMGYNNEAVYNLSQKIVKGEKGCFFGPAYNFSYCDTYDMASAGNKKSLKKLEIEMGMHHKELGFDWDQPVPEEKWHFVSEYCDNDVIATEAAFHYLKADFTARRILAALAGMSVNDTTNTLTTKIIFGTNRSPQGEFCYRNLAKPVEKLDFEVEAFLKEACPDMMSKSHTNDGLMLSVLPYFPGYKFENHVSTYKGIEVGEGGYVYSEPGIYNNIALLDVASMHPHSVISECLFGPRFTRRFREIVVGRVNIKHEAWAELDTFLDGKLKPFIQEVLDGKMTSKELANGIKTAINSVYGLTAAKFDNPFKDPRNIDNIVAKRGALFMINLKEEVQKRGFTVAHIKTDSIKIPNATPEIIKFVMDYGKEYGYTFEHEATYERMCLVNDAVYIAKYLDPDECQKLYGYVPSDNHKGVAKNNGWTATGLQFSVPYVFKKLFSKAEIEFDDLCETKAVTQGALYLDDGTEEKQFVGRVGQFCPMNEEVGLKLLCTRDDKFYSPPGCKDWLFLESEYVRQAHLEDKIDRSYYDDLANAAINTINQYGPFDIFAGDEKYPYELTTEYSKGQHEELPFDLYA